MGSWSSTASHRDGHDHHLGIDGKPAHGLAGVGAVVLHDRRVALFDLSVEDHLGRLDHGRVRRRPLDQRYVAVRYSADDLAHVEPPFANAAGFGGNCPTATDPWRAGRGAYERKPSA